MEQERRSIRVGLAVIACIVALKLISGGALESVAAFLCKPEMVSVITYLQTGRVLRTGPVQPQIYEDTETTAPTEHTEAALPGTEALFSEADAQLVQVSNFCNYTIDKSALLLSPLDWELKTNAPTVLIVHTHTTESYTKTSQQTYTESSAYRTLDGQYNMVKVGARLAECLRAGGVQVLHDTTVHDHPNYNNSYSATRKTIAKYLQQYPSIRMVLDIHRDASEQDDGTQLSTSASVNGAASAQLMMVVGTDANGLAHPFWQENMALAVKLHAQLEKSWPGLCRPISFRAERFNQDMCAGALLVEVGAAGDTLEEALVAAQALAEGILALSEGTTADSTS